MRKNRRQQQADRPCCKVKIHAHLDFARVRGQYMKPPITIELPKRTVNEGHVDIASGTSVGAIHSLW